MFIQVIKGRVKDKEALRAATEQWERELRPGAKGFLGSTSGVADDGMSIVLARFESEAAARANSDRPEQGAWWEETSKLFEGDPAFYDCPDVDVFLGGGSDESGFVQVMVYRPKDIAAIKGLSKEFEKVASLRPDILGGATAFATDGTVIDTGYFTSEADAREGERKQMPAELQEAMQRLGENAGEIEFVDIRDPWLY